jgi:peptidoglycan-associated lipoprotein
MQRSMLLLSVGVVAVVLAACGGKKPETTAAPQPNADSIAAAEKARQEAMAAAEAERLAREEAERLARQRTADSLAALGQSSEAVRTLLAAMIHFDLDKSVIRGNDLGVLDQKVSILQANSGARLRISGHCDERGSDEYNLALGNRRATSAKQYLVSHGVDAGRIETTSLGEERPLDPGHDEGAWSKNRRDEFDVVSGGDDLRQP